MTEPRTQKLKDFIYFYSATRVHRITNTNRLLYNRQLEILSAMGCDDGQGYLFGRPASAQRVTDFCRDWATREAAAVSALPRQIDRSLDDEAIA